jgi:hypothetical protein
MRRSVGDHWVKRDSRIGQAIRPAKLPGRRTRTLWARRICMLGY